MTKALSDEHRTIAQEMQRKRARAAYEGCFGYLAMTHSGPEVRAILEHELELWWEVVNCD